MRVQNQMLVLRIMAVGLLIAGALFTVSRAAADDGDICINSLADAGVAIAACTRAVVSGQYTNQSVATLYTSRGIAYLAKGQHDRAMQDFNQVIRLVPQFSRGDKTNPVAVGNGEFIFCCRVLLSDCRTKVNWAIRNIRGNAKRCAETCSRKLKC